MWLLSLSIIISFKNVGIVRIGDLISEDNKFSPGPVPCEFDQLPYFF